jgi:hypothetical protein
MSKNGLLQRDQKYRSSLTASADVLRDLQVELRDYQFNLESTEISEAILERLKAYYETQNQIKSMLHKRYAPAGADFFVESVLFFLKLVLASRSPSLEVHSERQIRRMRNAQRPDISIWKGDQVVATIECKTQLGWNRGGWEADFQLREQKLQTEFPKAKAFLLVMTGSNWGGFGDNKQLGKKYFCLLADVWPGLYKSPNQILTPIESLFKKVCWLVANADLAS